ncbi:MAG: hypothetical protein KAI17_24670, partial [Thiotrichaceae bacterium]|nr:hypothetical protein [Thiotrichaceae bacterium]
MSFKIFSKLFLFVGVSLFYTMFLSGCATFSSPSALQTADIKSKSEQSSDRSSSKQAVKNVTEPVNKLSRELLYDLLLAEISAQRSNYQLAFDKYYSAAVKTRDSRLAKKATRISLFSKNEQHTFKAVELWSEIEPNNIDVLQIYASSLIKKRQDEEAIVYLQRIIDLSDNYDDGLVRVVNILDTIKEQERVIKIYTQITEAHKDKQIVKLYWAKISLKYNDYQQAEKFLNGILSAQPDYLKALIVKVELYKKQKKNQQAIDVLQIIVQQSEDNISLRLELIRLLVAIEDYDEGFKQVQILAEKDLPPEVLFAISL